MLELISIQEPALFICPYEVQTILLKEISQLPRLFEIQWATREEIRDRFLYEITEETVWATMQYAKVSVETARYYLQAMVELEMASTLTDHPKVQFLKKLKDHLNERKLLSKDSLFTSWIKPKHVVVVGYSHLSPWFEKMFQKLAPLATSFEVIKPVVQTRPLTYHPFEFIQQEVHFIVQEIAAEIHSGVALDHLLLMNVGSEYEGLLFEAFHLHGIPYQLLKQSTLYEVPLIQLWINEMANTTVSLLEWWTDFKERPLKNEGESKIRVEFLNVLNRFTWFKGPLKEVEPLIKDVLLRTNSKRPYYQEVIKEVSLEQSVFHPEDRVYLLGLNQKSFPKTVRDDGYFSDSLAHLLGLPTSDEINRSNYLSAIQVLHSIPHPILTVKKNSLSQRYELSSLLLREKISQVDRSIYDENITFSERYDQLILGEKLDQFRLFRSIDETGLLLHRSYPESPYYTYRNEMTPISSETIDERFEHKLVLTPTKIDKFHRCGFAYYVENVLKIQARESSFFIYIGELFHYLLKEDHSENFDVVFDEYVNREKHSKREEFFLTILKEELRFVTRVNKEMEALSDFDDFKSEFDVKVPWRGAMNTFLQGRIDRLEFLFENDQSYLAVIDYKTGRTALDLKEMEFGLGVQLLVYLLMLKYSNEYQNIQWVGFYLQHILRKDLLTAKESTEEGLRKGLRLDGVTNPDLSILGKWDKSYPNSEKIRKLKLTQEGTFDKSAGLMSHHDIEELLMRLEQQIDKIINQIDHGHFPINPKIIKGKNRSCEFCDFHDLCFVTPKNYERLGDFTEEDEDESEEDDE